jgi:hypothetical protein
LEVLAAVFSWNLKEIIQNTFIFFNSYNSVPKIPIINNFRLSTFDINLLLSHNDLRKGYNEHKIYWIQRT